MKKSAIILLLLIPAIANAQSYQNMTPEEMQQMMQEMQSCMENIDQAKMKALEQRAKQFEAKFNKMCAAGKQDEAQAMAISFAQEITNDSTVQTLKKCSEMMSGMIPVQPFMEQDKYLEGDNVCDMQ